MPSIEELKDKQYLSNELSKDDLSFLIPLSQIDIPKDLPRKDLDEASLEELTNDIKKNGVLEPILVQRSTAKTGNTERFILQSGLRRFISAKNNHLPRIPARVLPFENQEDKLAIQLSENLQRKDLHPVEIANCIRKFLDLGYKEKELADKVSKSPAWVTKYKKISKMPLEILNDPVALRATLSDLLALESNFPIHSDLLEAWGVYKTHDLKSALRSNQLLTDDLPEQMPNEIKEIKRESITGITREILIVTNKQHVYNCKMHINENEDKECKFYIPKNVPLEELRDIFDKIIQSMDPT